MLKILKIVILSLLLSGNAFSAEELNKSKITNDWLINKTVLDLIQLQFKYSNPSITTTGNSVQYHLLRLLPDDKIVYVICFVDSSKTICRLP
jgi:hypothetical protein